MQTNDGRLSDESAAVEFGLSDNIEDVERQQTANVNGKTRGYFNLTFFLVATFFSFLKSVIANTFSKTSLRIQESRVTRNVTENPNYDIMEAGENSSTNGEWQVNAKSRKETVGEYLEPVALLVAKNVQNFRNMTNMTNMTKVVIEFYDCHREVSSNVKEFEDLKQACQSAAELLSDDRLKHLSSNLKLERDIILRSHYEQFSKSVAEMNILTTRIEDRISSIISIAAYPLKSN
mmetsp:Transcript_5933/g.8327  ORF Transcript_5933/g.8327 Transcript_5933/m.8327 type:complete len:234 (+) Transcript_5933:51-752(+)